MSGDGVKTFFLTRKNQSTIVPVQARSDGPRHIRIKTGICFQRIRRTTIYHAYHETFEQAQHWARVDLETKVKALKKELGMMQDALDKVVMLRESDLC